MSRHPSQDVCPWNEKFAAPLREEALRPRPTVAGKDARQLARDLLEMPHEVFSRAFRDSLMKRAKLRGLKRDSAVVLGNVGTAEDAPALIAALEDPEPLVRTHAAWALGQLGSPEAREALRARLSVELDEWVLKELESAVAS